jgi:hypothetical protein
VFIKNTGNTSISPCHFDIEIPGEHHQFLAELTTQDPDLRSAIEITWDEPQVTRDPRFHFRISPLLNSKEAFEVLLYFDKKRTDAVYIVGLKIQELRLNEGHISRFGRHFRNRR